MFDSRGRKKYSDAYAGSGDHALVEPSCLPGRGLPEPTQHESIFGCYAERNLRYLRKGGENGVRVSRRASAISRAPHRRGVRDGESVEIPEPDRSPEVLIIYFWKGGSGAARECCPLHPRSLLGRPVGKRACVRVHYFPQIDPSPCACSLPRPYTRWAYLLASHTHAHPKITARHHLPLSREICPQCAYDTITGPYYYHYRSIKY